MVSSIGTTLRRTLLLVMLAVGVGTALSWRNARAGTPGPSEPPQWPDLPGRADGGQTWVAADVDGSAPDTHPVKARDSSGIFHVPGGRFYDRTRPDRCYATTDDAEADGYRRSKA